jgi:hypothetical protein
MQVHLSVVDNTLVVHHPDTSVVILYDVALALPGSSQLANPLPLRRLQLLPPALAAAAMNADPSQDSFATSQQLENAQGLAAAANGAAADRNSSSNLSRSGSRTLLVSAASSGNIAAGTAAANPAAAAAGGEVDGDVYEASEAPHAASWRYFMPGVVLDVASKTIGRMQLDLQVSAKGYLCLNRPNSCSLLTITVWCETSVFELSGSQWFYYGAATYME